MKGLSFSVFLLATVCVVPILTKKFNVLPTNVCTEEINCIDSALQMVYHNRTDITIHLEAGEHCINKFDKILKDLCNVTIEGEANKETTVRCLPGKGLAVFNAANLTIRNVVFDQCGISNNDIFEFFATINKTIDFFFSISNFSNNNISLLCGHCVHFKMTGVIVKNTLGLGFLGINLIGESILNNTMFSNNVPTGCFFLSSDVLKSEKIGGGALLIYVDFVDNVYLNLTDTNQLKVNNSHFLYNSYCSKLYLTQFYSKSDYVNNNLNEEDEVYLLNGGGGLSLKLAQLGYKINISISNTIFMNNTARGGGGANIQTYTGVYNSSIEFVDCSFCKNGLTLFGEDLFDTRYSTFASGLLILTNNYNPQISFHKKQNIVPIIINIIGTNFTGNRALSAAAASVISLYSAGQSRQLSQVVMFSDCEFKQNYAFSGSALYIQEWKYTAAQPGLKVVLENVKVVENTNFIPQEFSSELIPSGVVHILAINVTLSCESIIKDNTGSGVYLERGLLYISGNVSIVNNSASLGAGIRVESQSLIIVSNNSELNLISNRAGVYGGGIYSNVAPESGQLQSPDCPIYFGQLISLCFQDFTEECVKLSELNVSVTFSNNYAQYGSMVYGSTLSSCPWAAQIDNSNREKNVFELLYEMKQNGSFSPLNFNVSNPPINSTEVATAPTQLLVSSNNSIAASPGLPVTVQAKAVDEFGFPTVTVLTSIVKENGLRDTDKSSQIGSTNYWLLDSTKSNFVSIPLKVFADASESGDFNVTLVTVGSYAQETIVVHLNGCCPGYKFVDRTCMCNVPAAVHCNDVDNSLSVPPDLWIGYFGDENETLITSPCHFDYCIRNDIKNVSCGDFSSQCNHGYNRDGVGCGRCKEGYGLVLGSNRCKKCSNLYLLLIIAFAFVGAALILLLIVFRITVANGYINGILFYSTIIALFSSVLTAQSNSTAVGNLLKLFSWLNLDIDIELCFYENMTASQRAALRFVFPVYLYLLILVVILLAKVSQRFANAFNRGGYSAMKLFATLFVLTYTNILRNCVEILGSSYVNVVDPNHITELNQSQLIWTVDPNQRYFSGDHIPLFILAIIVLVIYLIPAPLILLFPGVTLRIPVLKRYKPLYDAFWNPFKPRFQFWIGMRLLLRFFPMILNYSVETPQNVFILIIFLLLLVYAQATLQPFNGRGHNASDLFLLVNLTGLMSGFLFFVYINPNTSNINADQNIVYTTAYLSVCIGLVYFQLLIFLLIRVFVRFPILQYIGWKLITKVCRCKVFAKWIPKKPKISFKPRKRKRSYGTTKETVSDITTDVTSTSLELSDDSDESTRGSGRPTYSELREPLMDMCGEAEIQTRDVDPIN